MEQVGRVQKRDGCVENYDEAVVRFAISYSASYVGEGGEDGNLIASEIAKAITIYLFSQQSERTIAESEINQMIEKALVNLRRSMIARAFSAITSKKSMFDLFQSLRNSNVDADGFFTPPSDEFSGAAQDEPLEARGEEIEFPFDFGSGAEFEPETSEEIVRYFVRMKVEENLRTAKDAEPRSPSEIENDLGRMMLAIYALADVYSPEIRAAHAGGQIHIGSACRPLSLAEAELSPFRVDSPAQSEFTAEFARAFVTEHVRRRDFVSGRIRYHNFGLFVASKSADASIDGLKSVFAELLAGFALEWKNDNPVVLEFPLEVPLELAGHARSIEGADPHSLREEIVRVAKAYLLALSECGISPRRLPACALRFSPAQAQRSDAGAVLKTAFQILPSAGLIAFEIVRDTEPLRPLYHLLREDLFEGVPLEDLNLLTLQKSSINAFSLAAKAGAGNLGAYCGLLRTYAAVCVDLSLQKLRQMRRCYQGAHPIGDLAAARSVVTLEGLSEAACLLLGRGATMDDYRRFVDTSLAEANFQLGVSKNAHRCLLSGEFESEASDRFERLASVMHSEALRSRFGRTDHKFCGTLLDFRKSSAKTRLQIEGRIRQNLQIPGAILLDEGEGLLSSSRIADILEIAIEGSEARRIAFENQLTECRKCAKHHAGFHSVCPSCKSAEVSLFRSRGEGFARLSDSERRRLADKRSMFGDLFVDIK
ncbi:MAG: hypothetical protein NUW37_13060 [Planctomycetes bacterium]|nr:hypothetical protein [Planctomycetota bacterium]